VFPSDVSYRTKKAEYRAFYIGAERPITGGTILSPVNLDIVKTLPITWNPAIGMTSRGQE